LFFTALVFISAVYLKGKQLSPATIIFKYLKNHLILEIKTTQEYASSNKVEAMQFGYRTII